MHNQYILTKGYLLIILLKKINVNDYNDNNDIFVNKCNVSNFITLENQHKAIDKDFDFVYIKREEKKPFYFKIKLLYY